MTPIETIISDFDKLYWKTFGGGKPEDFHNFICQVYLDGVSDGKITVAKEVKKVKNGLVVYLWKCQMSKCKYTWYEAYAPWASAVFCPKCMNHTGKRLKQL